jgi:hypothetical protein
MHAGVILLTLVGLLRLLGGKKADLFFAAMLPPPLSVEQLLGNGAGDADVLSRLENIALGMLDYHRELVSILVPLMSHPSFDFERFAQRHPESPLARLRLGLVEYLEAQQGLGRVAPGNVGVAALVLVATVHGLALFEKLGVHRGKFEEGVVRATVRSIWWGLAPQGERGS